jgi:hypothetical protein
MVRNIWGRGVYVSIFGLACVVLSGCGSGGSQLTNTPVQSGASSNWLGNELGTRVLDASGAYLRWPKQNSTAPSWMLPEAKTEDLLYISNVYTVTVYSYPKGKHVGTLKGFYRPLGECSDEAGDVFIADGGDSILEYAHGGKKPIQTLTLSGYGAQSCAVDPTTGNLAVTWDDNFTKGYVAVYKNASGNPTLYTNGDMLFSFCGYDPAGSLYVDGTSSKGNEFLFAELPEGSGTMQTITLDQSFQHWGAVQWDGKYVAVTDNEVNTMYRFTISGSSGTLEGTVDLGGAQPLYQLVIDGKKVVGADDLSNAAWYWDYPAGGSPVKSITEDVFHPFGATISKAPK